MPTVALIFEYPTLNGGERSMLQMVDRMDPSGLQIVAVAPAGGRLSRQLSSQQIQHYPIQLHDQQGARLPPAVVQDRLVAVVRDIQPDLVHANSLSMGRLTGAVASRLAVPCVAHLRDIIRLSRAAVSDLSRNQVLIAVSQATREFHVGQGLQAERVRMIYNGIDATQFYPGQKTGRLLQELGLPSDRFVLLTIGQIALRKGQDVLADAAPRIAARVPNVAFVVVGERNSTKSESKAFEAAIQSTFARHGLSDRLHLLGYRDDVAELLREADLLVHPAKQEPLGRVLLEAAASALPIVATAVGGTGEIVTDRVSATLVPPNYAELLAAAVIELAGNPTRRRSYAAHARQHVLKTFDLTLAAARLRGIWLWTGRGGDWVTG